MQTPREICMEDIIPSLQTNVNSIKEMLDELKLVFDSNPAQNTAIKQKIQADASTKIDGFIDNLSNHLDFINITTNGNSEKQLDALSPKEQNKTIVYMIDYLLKETYDFIAMLTAEVQDTSFSIEEQRAALATLTALSPTIMQLLNNVKEFTMTNLYTKALLIIYTSVNPIYMEMGKIVYSNLTPTELNDALKKTLRDIDKGCNFPSNTNAIVQTYSTPEERKRIQDELNKIYEYTLKHYLAELSKLRSLGERNPIINSVRQYHLPSFDTNPLGYLQNLFQTHITPNPHDSSLILAFRGMRHPANTEIPYSKMGYATSYTNQFRPAANFSQGPAGSSVKIISYNDLGAIGTSLQITKQTTAYPSENEHLFFNNCVNALTLYVNVILSDGSIVYFDCKDIYTPSPNFTKFNDCMKTKNPYEGTKTVANTVMGTMTLPTCEKHLGKKLKGETEAGYYERIGKSDTTVAKIETLTNGRRQSQLGCVLS